MLYCFVELFSLFSFFVLLSNNYTGDDISETYCYNIIDNQEIKKQINLKVNRVDIDVIFKSIDDDNEMMTEKSSRIMSIVNKIQIEKALFDIVQKVIEKFLNKYKNESIITKEMLYELAQEVSIAYKICI